MPWNPRVALTEKQNAQLDEYADLLRHYNSAINLISRDTEDAIEERHLLHCLSFTQHPFPEGSILVDWGTGGGLPAVPLAICFPECTVHAVDAVGKKISAVQAIGRRLGLTNLHPWHGRAEAFPYEAHYSVSRATAPLADLWTWHAAVVKPFPVALPQTTGPRTNWPPGLICLKGGDLHDEIAELHDAFPDLKVEQIPLEPLLERPYFAEKYIVAVAVAGAPKSEI